MSLGSEHDTAFLGGERGAPNTDATPCIAVDAQGGFPPSLRPEENGYLPKFVLDQG